MFLHKPTDLRQLVIAEPTVRRQRHRIEPILRVTARMRYMNMRRFLILETRRRTGNRLPSAGPALEQSTSAARRPGTPASFVPSQVFKQLRQWSRFLASALRNGLQQHRLGVRIGFEGFVAFRDQYGHGCAFR